MPSHADAWRQVIEQPLAYLHPARLSVPRDLDTPHLRTALGPVLVEALGLAPGQGQWACQPECRWWVQHWRCLPSAAHWVAAYLLWPQLAWGAALQGLSPAQRRFATFALGARAPSGIAPAVPLPLRLEATGLRCLQGAAGGLPVALRQRLPLQFSPAAEALALTLPALPADFRLLVQAVNYARFSQNAG
ncbi:hypothetical protein [Pseudomonas typographi]|uniref:Type III secretion apparatus protein OrgA/MxiK n=1 Tax=Pseudomonas typographi TaxID=2715964 RepID=A0ABR7Z2D8_9PSED|nr:hypothetical protein [Pseudomonas typographi]MBD1552404.1 hypothetical protein [Pseudomonas typographi]MBD1587201.1 hypothetical protein [Pseudomonas typographi]MBD1599514.1 hypothetical protein [Pseudomonas typographi]